MPETIALFGATGGTGRYVLPLALEQGYKVQALVRTPSKVETKNDNLTLIEGDFGKEDAIKETVKGATYVVCVAGGPLGKPKEYPPFMMSDFVEKLFPIMDQEDSVKFFLFQAGAFNPKPDGSNVLMMKMMRATVGRAMGLTPNVADNTKCTKFIGDNDKEVSFKAIVTRPGMIKDKEGGQTLVAADAPPMGPIAFKDLAAFTLQAMKDESLVGRYPFVSVKK